MMKKLTAKEFVNNKLGDKNYTHSPYPMYRREIEEWLIEYAALINLSLGNVIGTLPTRKVCFFALKDGKYLTENNIEITTDMLTKYNHQITDSWSYIILD